MGGSFAPGEDLFYVYWAISIPITFALLIWVIHTEVREWWNDQEENTWSGRKKVALKKTYLMLRSGTRDVEKGSEGTGKEGKTE